MNYPLSKKSDLCEICPFKEAFFVPCWHVGEEAEVLFVGKTARASENKSTKYWKNRASELFLNSSWPYWRYTKEIATYIYGDNAWNKIAMTNLIKCNLGSTKDMTSDSVKDFCIVKQQFIATEISQINPKKIIFYTHPHYDRYLKKIFQIEKEKHLTVLLGKKKVDFWFFNITLNGKKISCLRTGHPERKKKLDFVQETIQFLTKKEEI